MLKKRK